MKHIETEILNKASLVLRIGFKKDSTGLLKVQQLKTRMLKRPETQNRIK